METPDIEEARRIARELEHNERKRGGLGFELPLDFDLDDFEEYGWLFLAVAACIGLSIYLGSFTPIIYLVVVIGAGMVLALAWMIVAPIYEFVMDNLEDIRESVAVIPGLLLGIGMFVSSLSQGKNVVEAFVLAFISFALISGLSRLAFWLLELAVENWGWAMVLGLFAFGAVFG